MGLCIQAILIVHVFGILNICSMGNMQYFFMDFKLRNQFLQSAECLLNDEVDIRLVWNAGSLKAIAYIFHLQQISLLLVVAKQYLSINLTTDRVFSLL